MIRNEDNPENSVLPLLISPLTEPRGQVQFCQNLIANLSEEGESPYTKQFSDVKIKRQLFDHYLKGICSLKSQYGIYTIEIRSPNAFHYRYLIQADDVDIEFSKVFTQYIESIQNQNSIRANSIFTNDVFSLIYSYLSFLEMNEPQGDSPTQTSRLTMVRQEIHKFSNFLNATREDLSRNEKTQHVWDPELSHESVINIPTDISNQAISTISISKDYVRIYPLTVDATPLNYNLNN